MTTGSLFANASPAPYGAIADLAQPPGLHPLDQMMDSLATRVRGWYLMSVTHPLWANFIPNATEDEGYYIGGERQWSHNGSLEALRYLQSQTPPRTTVSINHIQAVVDVLVGYERSNRSDLKASPQGEEDSESARILSWLLKFQQDQMDLQEHESELFEDGLVRGCSAGDIGIDFTDDRSLNGKITVDILRPGEDVIWDPYTRKYDLSDSRFVLKYSWVYVTDIAAQFPEHETEIQNAIQLFGQQYPLGAQTSSGPLSDAYGSTAHPTAEQFLEWQYFYDPKDRRLLVLEAWYREYIPTWLAVNVKAGIIKKFTSEADAKELASGDPTNWRITRKLSRPVRVAMILPFSLTLLEDGPSPYTNDDEHYPIIPFIAKKKGDVMYGMVRNLKDAQMVENKRISQVLDILARWANIRPLVPKGTLTDIRDIEDHSSTSAIEYDKEKGPPTWYHPEGLAEVAQVLVQVASQFKLNLREISGINPDLLGLRSDDTSGIAIARRQAQSQVIATIYFDRFKWTRRLMGERLARRIQQRYTTAEILRLIDPDSGEHVRVYINPPETANMSPDELEAWRDQRRDASGRPYILRSVEALKYDVTISDTPSTPTARATALLALLEVVGKMPSILPAVVDEILSLADIPDKPKILRRVRALMAAQGIDVDGSGAAPPSGPGGPPQPGGGAPPPGGVPPVMPPGGPPPPGMPPGGPPLPGTPTIPGQTPSAAPPPPPPAQIPQGMPVAPGGPLAPIPGVRRSSGARRLRNQMPGGQTQVLG